MFVIDSNILIYSAKPEYSFLRTYFTSSKTISAVSVVYVIEVLGFHK